VFDLKVLVDTQEIAFISNYPFLRCRCVNGEL
jgi:hypothetical protein